MIDESFPSPHFSNLVRRLDNLGTHNIRRNWTGNDQSDYNHHGRVPLSESPLILRLSWKDGPNDPVQLVGVFELNLMGLLSAGYVRIEPKKNREIRLRFCKRVYHDEEVIFIQVNDESSGLPIGAVRSASP